MYGHPTFATKAGNMLQKAMIPFGVEGGTRSRAADKMMTYNTNTDGDSISAYIALTRGAIKHTIIYESKQKEGYTKLEY